MNRLVTRQGQLVLAALVLACVASPLLSSALPTMSSRASPLPSRVRSLPRRPDSLPSSSECNLKRASSAIAITPDGLLVLAVNPDSNSLSIVDTLALVAMPEIAVGADPRCVAVDDTGRRAYVTNRLSDSVSVVDLGSRMVVNEVTVGNRPYGVTVSPTGDRIYVAEQGADRARVLDALTLATLALVPTHDRPSGLALSGDGRTLYVTHLLSDIITVLTVRPFATVLPLILKGGTTSWRLRSEVVVRLAEGQGVQEHQAADYAVTSIHLWPDSNLVQSIVISPDGDRAYVPHTRSNTNNRALTFDTTVFPILSAIDTAERTHLVGQHLSMDTLDPPGVGLPFDAAFTPDGGEIWVLNAASNDVTVVNMATRQRAAHIEVGANPRGIVVSPDGTRVYVNNTLSGTVSVIDTATYAVTADIATTDIPLPPVLLNGKRLFHSSDDPRLARDQWISCNTCHFEGEQDGRTWFFGFAGPRNTTSLMGMIETYPLRWSGEWDESADSEFANRKENFGSGLIDGDMNCSVGPAGAVQPGACSRGAPVRCRASGAGHLQPGGFGLCHLPSGATLHRPANARRWHIHP